MILLKILIFSSVCLCLCQEASQNKTVVKTYKSKGIAIIFSDWAFKSEMKTYKRVQLTQRISLSKIKELCRLCMNSDSAMYDIFTVSENNQDLSLSSKILKCLSIEVKDRMELPNKLCRSCLKSLNAFTEFWELCHQTDKKLHHIIESSNTSSRIEVTYQSSPLQSSKTELFKSWDDSYSQLYSIDEEDPAHCESPPHYVQSPSDFPTNTAVEESSETRLIFSCQSPKEAPTLESPPCGLFENTYLEDVETSPKYEVEEVCEVNGVEVQVSMNGSSYIVEVLEESNNRDSNEVSENVTNSVEKTPENIDGPTIPNYQFAFKCPHCKDSFDNSSDLKSHVKVHSDAKGFICKVCCKYFCIKSSLLRHERIHSGERPFKCDHCPSSFKQREVLRRHVLIHSNEKPFKCESCDKSYTQKEALKNHVKSNHIPKISLEILQYKCPLCEKSFCHLSGLSRHQKSHAGKKYPCKSCDKVFTDQSCLKRHHRRAHLSGNSQAVSKKDSTKTAKKSIESS